MALTVALSCSQCVQSTYIFTYRFSDGSSLLLYMGDRCSRGGEGLVCAASHSPAAVISCLTLSGVSLRLTSCSSRVPSFLPSCRWNPYGPGSVGNASYVWLPLLPKLDSIGFELIWEEAWSLVQYKGASFDGASQQVVFADGTRRAALAPPHRLWPPQRTASSSRLGRRPWVGSQGRMPTGQSTAGGSGGQE